MQVAIKIENPSANKSLKHETKILNYLYSNKIRTIPSIYWYGLYRNLPCLIIPYYKCSLKTYMEKCDKSNISKIARQIISILKDIHGQYIVHRDLKPDNFMIKDDGNITMIDFGLSTFYVGENSKLSPNVANETIIGTPKYISIRIFEGNRYTIRDDLISLGYMCAGFYLGHTPWEPDGSSIISHEQDDSHLYNSLNIKHPINIWRRKYRNMEWFKKWLPHYNDILNYLEETYTYQYEELPDYNKLTQFFI